MMIIYINAPIVYSYVEPNLIHVTRKFDKVLDLEDNEYADLIYHGYPYSLSITINHVEYYDGYIYITYYVEVSIVVNNVIVWEGSLWPGDSTPTITANGQETYVFIWAPYETWDGVYIHFIGYLDLYYF